MKLFRSGKKEITEKELIAGCLAQKRDMQRLLYDRYAATMKAVCLRYVRTSFEAEDLLHDAFMKVFMHLSSFKQDCPLEAWIRRIVVNTALSHYRSPLHKVELVEASDLELSAEPEIALPEQTAEEIVDFLGQLPEKYRIVFNLHAIEGYSHKEIGELLNQKEVTIRSQYLRARTMLKELLEKDYRYHEKVRS